MRFSSTSLAPLLVLASSVAADNHEFKTQETKNHVVTVGRHGQYKFEPSELEANIGDTVTYHFYGKNHSVVQGSFEKPCQYLEGGFYSGWVLDKSHEMEASTTFTITIEDDEPIYVYDGQISGINHCHNGMVQVINGPDDEDEDYDSYRDNSIESGETTAPPGGRPTGGVRKIRVEVGQHGTLTYRPNNITEPVGSIVEFHFNPRNHTVTQSTFANPCQPVTPGFDSGFIGTTKTPSEATFEVLIDDDKPKWFYCAQARHCQTGMVGAINAPLTGNTLDTFVATAQAVTHASHSHPTAPLGGSFFVRGNAIEHFHDNGNVIDVDTITGGHQGPAHTPAGTPKPTDENDEGDDQDGEGDDDIDETNGDDLDNDLKQDAENGDNKDNGDDEDDEVDLNEGNKDDGEGEDNEDGLNDDTEDDGQDEDGQQEEGEDEEPTQSDPKPASTTTKWTHATAHPSPKGPTKNETQSAGGGAPKGYNWGPTISDDAVYEQQAESFFEKTLEALFKESIVKLETGDWAGKYPESIVETLRTSAAQAKVHYDGTVDVLTHYQKKVPGECKYDFGLTDVDSFIRAAKLINLATIGCMIEGTDMATEKDHWMVPLLASEIGAKARFAAVLNMIEAHVPAAAPREVMLPCALGWSFIQSEYVDSCPDAIDDMPDKPYPVIDITAADETDGRITSVTLKYEVPASQEERWIAWIAEEGQVEFTKVAGEGAVEVPQNIYGHTWVALVTKPVPADDLEDVILAGPEPFWVAKPGAKPAARKA